MGLSRGNGKWTPKQRPSGTTYKVTKNGYSVLRSVAISPLRSMVCRRFAQHMEVADRICNFVQVIWNEALTKGGLNWGGRLARGGLALGSKRGIEGTELSLAAASFQFRLLEQGLSLSVEGMSVCGWSTKRQALVVNRMEAQQRQTEERGELSPLGWATLSGLCPSLWRRTLGIGNKKKNNAQVVRNSLVDGGPEGNYESSRNMAIRWRVPHCILGTDSAPQPLRHSKPVGRRQMPPFGQQDEEVHVLPIVLSQPGRQLVTLINAALH